MIDLASRLGGVWDGSLGFHSDIAGGTVKDDAVL
jgi:hypothetical protein